MTWYRGVRLQLYNSIYFSDLLKQKRQQLHILVSLSESKIDHTGSNTTSNYYADESVQSSLLSIYWQSYQNTLALVWNLPGWHYIPLLQSTLVVFVMFQREAKNPEWVKGLYLRVTKARYLGLTRQNQLWLSKYFGHLIKTRGSPSILLHLLWRRTCLYLYRPKHKQGSVLLAHLSS